MAKLLEEEKAQFSVILSNVTEIQDKSFDNIFLFFREEKLGKREEYIRKKEYEKGVN